MRTFRTALLKIFSIQFKKYGIHPKYWEFTYFPKGFIAENISRNIEIENRNEKIKKIQNYFLFQHFQTVFQEYPTWPWYQLKLTQQYYPTSAIFTISIHVSSSDNNRIWTKSPKTLIMNYVMYYVNDPDH